ncbi:MAG: DUF4492 domain-containing protein [Desulfopila sp.]
MLDSVKRVYGFYRDGFRRMTLGRTLWKIIIIKLVVMFGILKLFFFPNYLNTNFETDKQRADHVIENITSPAKFQHEGRTGYGRD